MDGNDEESAISEYGKMRSPVLFGDDRVKSILTIQAHQDDTDIACGGTIAKLTSMGKKVTYLILTDGRHGVLDADMPANEAIQMRNGEQERAAKILGVSDVKFLDYQDQHLDSSLELRRR
ncbi:MAG TPA: PIG-L family deacetylase, partial [Candidatus Lokiarchaeia archaeon]|nr:PIG-L family deacetylase [Candidatus Lokiarchaeia archaeon]